jgi:hypothetical protein
MIDWESLFQSAQKLCSIALYGGERVPTPDERQKAALEFSELIELFRDGGQPAAQTLEKNLYGNGRYTAAYILIEIADYERLSAFGKEMTAYDNSYPPLPFNLLKRLWTIQLPPNAFNLFWEWVQKGIHTQLPLFEALLTYPNDEAANFFQRILSSGHSKQHSAGIANTWGVHAIRLVASWKQPELLHNVIDNPHLFLPPIEHAWESDIRQEAALYLGLMGDQTAIAFLESLAEKLKGFEAAQACRRLALLAQSSAIEPIVKLLHDDDGSVVNIALDAASIISCTDLIPPLLDLMRREIYADGYHEPLCDDAFRVVRSIIEDPSKSPFQEEMIEGSYGDYGGILTEAFRQKAVDYYRSQFKTLKPARRYLQGELLTLKHLASDLLSPHWGPFERGAYNLTAITGEDHGLDLSPYSSNFITNILAILEWEKRAENPEPLEPGGWAFYGNKIDG